jgi:hypothetical protein
MMQGTMSAPVAPPSPRLELSFRNLLLLAVPVLAIGLRWGYGMSTRTVTTVVAPILLFSFALGPLLRLQARRFERELLRRIQLRQTGGLRSLYARQVLLRLFASPAYLAARRAMIAQELGEHGAAKGAFRLALSGTEEAAQLPLIVGLANACYALGDDAEAEPLYRDALRRGARYPTVFHHLAHGLGRRNIKLDEAIELAEEGCKATGGARVQDPPLEELLTDLRGRRRQKRK